MARFTGVEVEGWWVSEWGQAGASYDSPWGLVNPPPVHLDARLRSARRERPQGWTTGVVPVVHMLQVNQQFVARAQLAS